MKRFRSFLAALLAMAMIVQPSAVGLAETATEFHIPSQTNIVVTTPSQAALGQSDDKPVIVEVETKATPSDAPGGLGAVSSGLTPGKVRAGRFSLLRGTLPDDYDARNTISAFPEVKNQGIYGTCWAFSATAQAEISAAVKGESADYSEGALAYFVYHHPTDPLGLTAGDSTSTTIDWKQAGGHTYQAAFAYAGGIGPSEESSAPYSELEDGYDIAVAYDRTCLLTGAKWYNKADTELIKQAIRQNGSVGACFYWDSSCLRTADGNSYYYQKTKDTLNHAVTLIGWNDNISRDLFGITPAGDGAWLARNSWGEGWGSDGYFWISYDDPSLQDFRSMEFASGDEEWDNLYHYDGTGSTAYLTCSKGKAYANVFRAQNDEMLDAVSVAFYDANVSYNVQIYKKSSAMSSATDGTPMLSTPVSGTTDATGIYMVKLPTAVPLKKGEYFSVAITVNAQANMFIDQSYVDGVTQYTNHCEAGQSYSGNYDLSNANPKYCLRIKAYTNDAQSYGITYVLNGGTNAASNPSEYSNTETITLKDPTRTGYTFGGWYTNSEFTGSKVTKIPAGSAGDKTFYAKWTAITYALSYALKGGTLSENNPTIYNVETETFTLNNPTKEGYSFAGWTGTGLAAPAVTVEIPKGSTGHRSYTATWTINQYTISFDSKGGTEVAPITQNYDTAVAPPANPTREGYTFAGWDPEVPERMPAGNKTIEARWTADKYTISYLLNGGTTEQENPTGYDIETETFTLNNPTKTGHTFAGWTGTGLEEATENVTIAKGSTGNRSYTANWTINQYTISFNSDGGSTVASITQDYNTEVTKPVGPTKTGYTFAGWAPEMPEKMPAENISLKAQWTANKYTIKFNANGGTGTMADLTNVAYDTTRTLTVNAFKRTGYTFSGWSTTSAGAVKYKDKASVKNLSTTNSATVTLYAVWTVNKYTIKFSANGGTGTMASLSGVSYDTYKTLTANKYKRTGYTFSGWSTTSTGSVKYKDKASVKGLTATNNATVTLYAKWTANKYTIKFNANGGTGTMSSLASVSYGTYKTLTANKYKRTGYTFAGWSTTKTGTVKYKDKASVRNLTSISNGTVTLYAVWTKTKYKITYNLNGGKNNTKNPTSFYYTTADIKLQNPTRAGYTFLGWYSDSKFKTKVTVIKKGSTGNKTLYAKWKKK